MQHFEFCNWLFPASTMAVRADGSQCLHDEEHFYVTQYPVRYCCSVVLFEDAASTSFGVTVK